MTIKDAMPTVLVIDDELGPRESLRFLLKNEYRVLCADNVDRGLELLRENPLDAVILDIRMPGRSGIEGLREIRRLDADVAIIMLTGYAAIDTAQDAVRHEANDYMEKPFDTVEMCQAVARHVSRTRLRRQRTTLSREVDRMHQQLADEMLRHSQLVEMGQASAEFMHDIRNVFAIVSGTSELLRHELIDNKHSSGEPSAQTIDNLGRLDRTVQRCRELLDTWQLLLRQKPSHFTTVNLDELVRDVVFSCQQMVQAKQATIAYEPDQGPAVTVVGNPVQLSRAIANVVQNAIQALPPSGGLIRLAAERSGGNVCLRVIDNGSGISPEHIGQVFNPNFTTKRAHGGMGLGLFIVRKIVESHSGSVTAASEAGHGATLTLTLPLAAAPVLAPAKAPAALLPTAT